MNGDKSQEKEVPPQLYGGGWWSDVSEKTTLTQHWLSDPKDGWVLGPCRLRAQHTEGPPERTGLEGWPAGRSRHRGALGSSDKAGPDLESCSKTLC